MVEVKKVEILVRMTLTLTKSGGGKACKCFRIQHKNTLKLQSACRIALDGEGGDMGGGASPWGAASVNCLSSCCFTIQKGDCREMYKGP